MVTMFAAIIALCLLAWLLASLPLSIIVGRRIGGVGATQGTVVAWPTAVRTPRDQSVVQLDLAG